MDGAVGGCFAQAAVHVLARPATQYPGIGEPGVFGFQGGMDFPGERAPLERAGSIEGVEWRVEQDLPPMACSDDDFADAVLAAARAAQSGTPEHVVKPHATDAGWLADAGTACVICGAAESGEAHTDTESVSWAVLDRCYRIYRGVAANASAFA